MKLWGGRFRKDENRMMEDFNSSFSFDSRLYREDITGSMAHVRMLSACGIIAQEERDAILEGLGGILRDIESGALALEGEYDVINTFVELHIIERI